MFKLDPLTRRQFQRFRSIKRGYYSFWVFWAFIFLSLIAELWVNNRALLVRYEGRYFFPTYGDMIPGKVFGLDYDYETNYRQLKKSFSEQNSGNFAILPLIPYGAYETDLKEGTYPPYPPSRTDQHYLGTDTTGRDIAARLIYGFRTAIFFSLILLFFEYLIGITLGCFMGYVGGRFDLFFQRIIEIWSNVPFLYIVIIISSLMVPHFWMLIFIMVLFGWMSMTWYMRSATYKEKARDYVLAAKALGASDFRIIYHHILPNTASLLVTFLPFAVSSGIVALTSLDYLGFGLPAPTPSWGELLKQGTTRLESKWIVSSVVIAMVLILTMVTFIGEALREAFDPKKYSYYE